MNTQIPRKKPGLAALLIAITVCLASSVVSIFFLLRWLDGNKQTETATTQSAPATPPPQTIRPPVVQSGKVDLPPPPIPDSRPSPSADLPRLRAEVATAQVRFDKAYRTYTELATSNKQGNIETAQAQYRSAYEALNAAKARLQAAGQ